jgi:hypothetical protein
MCLMPTAEKLMATVQAMPSISLTGNVDYFGASFGILRGEGHFRSGRGLENSYELTNVLSDISYQLELKLLAQTRSPPQVFRW